MDKNLNTDCTEDTDLAFSQIFLVSKWYWIYFQIFVDSRVLGHSLFLKGISKSFSCISPDFSPVL